MEAFQQKIFIVGDNITNLTIGKNALADKYSAYTIPSRDKLLIMLENKTRFNFA